MKNMINGLETILNDIKGFQATIDGLHYAFIISDNADYMIIFSDLWDSPDVRKIDLQNDIHSFINERFGYNSAIELIDIINENQTIKYDLTINEEYRYMAL